MTFAALEARVNAAVIARLANVQVAWTPAGDGMPGTFMAEFDVPYLDVLDTVSSDPRITYNEADDPGLAVGDGVVVRETSYRVANIEPDGAGMRIAHLEAV